MLNMSFKPTYCIEAELFKILQLYIYAFPVSNHLSNDFELGVSENSIKLSPLVRVNVYLHTTYLMEFRFSKNASSKVVTTERTIGRNMQSVMKTEL